MVTTYELVWISADGAVVPMTTSQDIDSINALCDHMNANGQGAYEVRQVEVSTRPLKVIRTVHQ